ncbi:hypothetical protein [Phytoactinopolyspora limicola]|uniref:hypothetical protein n=1 Tax=Phytoactinopolyspora limicola TaxID=2715536 RepID=UPI00140E484D|nr:hypothetical protein [Phytoactinopolyspora limicola]
MNYDGTELFDGLDNRIDHRPPIGISTKPGESNTQPNPEYEALLQLKADVERDKPDVRGQLHDIAEAMGNGTVWFGPQAREFSEELEAYKNQLRDRSDDLPDDVQEKLNRTPSTIPAGGNQLPV